MRRASETLPVRLAIVLAAIIFAAWFSLAARQARDLTDVAATVRDHTRLTAAEADRALDQLRRAALLNPDRSVDLLRARVLNARGRDLAALGVLRALVRAEPDNLAAWYAIAATAHDAQVVRWAVGHLAILEPNHIAR